MPSIADLERLLAKAPGDADLLYGLAMEHAKSGRVEVACGFFDRCLEADAGYCYAYFHKARALEGAGRVEEAASVLKAGLEAARKVADRHAESEIEAYLDEIG